MSDPDSRERITGLLQRVSHREQELVEELFPVIYRELRYFGGLTTPEAAVVLGVSEATVAREWRVARAWLRRELSTN